MALQAGARLGAYEVVASLGAGGMGEVYRARDTKLAREVAIKVLPEAFAQDPERLARFNREAQLLAALNHPNIGAIHGLEEQNGAQYLVLELVEGRTLAEQLASGSLPVEEAAAVCRQIAEALEAAHEKGIVHRDLKPANVKITPTGRVKVLDFGLAKDLAQDRAMTTAADLSRSPTMTTPAATRLGVVLGTAAYMSPEQARGKTVDKRADIWAFGCVLYEALTARQAFPGETVTDTFAAIVKSEPDWNALPASAPPRLLALLKRCLHKDPMLRLRDIGEARIELDGALQEPLAETLIPAIVPAVASAPVPQVRARSLATRIITWAALATALAVALAAAVGAGWWLKPQPPQPLRRAVIPVPNVDQLWLFGYPALAISPDGRNIVFIAARGSVRQLYLRPLDRTEATPIEGTAGALGPFFSPDGQWLGFFAQGRLAKVPLTGGSPISLCDSAGRGAAWSADNTIVFDSPQGLYRVPDSGGTPEALTTIQNNEGGHRWPEILPGGKAILFTAFGGSIGTSKIAVYDLGSKQRRDLVTGGSNPRYSPTGHLVYLGSSGLLAVPFDAKRLEVSGAPFPLPEPVSMAGNGIAYMTFSREGSLVYVAGTAASAAYQLVWVSRDGSATLLAEQRRAYAGPRLSPDGRRVALELLESPHNVWTYDIARNVLMRLTFESAHHSPIFTPDGQRVTFTADGSTGRSLAWKAADGSGNEERLIADVSGNLRTGSWSPDGKFLAYWQTEPASKSDVWVLPLEGERKPRPFVQTPAEEQFPVFSPDGRFIAYQSDESGRFEIYVRPFPGPGGKWQISTAGGAEARWSRDGRELFYRSEDKMMAVSIALQPAFTPGAPRQLFEGPYLRGSLTSNYDVSPDGRRFVMIRQADERAAIAQMHLVLNWFEELKRAGR